MHRTPEAIETVLNEGPGFQASKHVPSDARSFVVFWMFLASSVPNNQVEAIASRLEAIATSGF